MERSLLEIRKATRNDYSVGSKWQKLDLLNPVQPSVSFDIETNHFLCPANQITGCYMKCSTVLKWIKFSALIIQKSDDRTMALKAH